MEDKDIDATQLDLFGFDPKDKEKFEKEQIDNKIKSDLHRKLIKQKKIKEDEEFIYANQEKYFNEALEQTKKYLSWGRYTPESNKSLYVSESINVTGDNYFFSEDLAEREECKYCLWYVKKNLQAATNVIRDKRIFEIKWILPLFEEAMGYVADKHMIYPTFEDYKERNFIDFECENEMYTDLIDECRKLLDPELKHDYFLRGIRFNVRKGFKRIYYNKEKDLNFENQPEYLESMSLSQEKNVLTFQWILPEEISKIHIADDDEFYSCFRYWLQ